MTPRQRKLRIYLWLGSLPILTITILAMIALSLLA